MCTLPEALPSILAEHTRKCLELGRESRELAPLSGNQWEWWTMDLRQPSQVWLLRRAPQGDMRFLHR